MRRGMRLTALMLALAAAISGCHRLVEPETASISVYATFWPIYALTDAVADDVPDVTLHQLTQPQDGCLRDYRLSDWDAAILSADADAVIMGGRGLESFESTLFGWGESGPAISAVLYNLELYNQDAKTDDESESHLQGPDPHLYLSLDGASQIIESICASLQAMDPKYAERYIENAQNAEKRVANLLAENRALLAGCAGGRVVLMNEALIYPALDYGLEIVDWIDRESGQALAGNDLSACLARLESSGAKVLLIEKQAPQAFTQALEGAGYQLARLDVLSAHREGEGFEAYLEIQSANARVIYDAFERAAGED